MGTSLPHSPQGAVTFSNCFHNFCLHIVATVLNYYPRKFLKSRCGPSLKKVGRPWRKEWWSLAIQLQILRLVRTCLIPPARESNLRPTTPRAICFSTLLTGLRLLDRDWKIDNLKSTCLNLGFYRRSWVFSALLGFCFLFFFR